MPRNGSGTYALPAGNPVSSGTLIEASWANTTLSDLASAMTDSLARSGEGGMTGPLRATDGTVSVPSISFVSETSTGFYRAGATNVRFAMSGVDVATITTTGVGIGTSSPTSKLTIAGTGALQTMVTGTDTGNGYIQFIGAASARLGYVGFGDASTNLYLWNDKNAAIRFGTNDTERLRLDSSGNLGLGVTPSAWGSNTKAFQFAKGTSTGSVSSVLTSDEICFSRNAYHDNTNFRYVVSSSFATSYQQSSAGDHRWFIAPSGTAGNAISFTQAMTLDASGNLGVGVSAPTFGRVHIKGANNNVAAYADGVRVTSNNETVETAYTWNGINANSNLTFATASTERARITSLGQFSVNNTSPPADSQFFVTNASNMFAGTFTNSSLSGYGISVGTDSAYLAYFYNSASRSGGPVGGISHNGFNVSFNTSSDYRLKENIQLMTGGLAKVAQLKPCTYTWKANGTAGQGFIAHELAEVVPDAVTGEKDAVNEDGSIKAQGIDTSYLVATLTAAIQEQQAIIQSLTARIEALEAAA